MRKANVQIADHYVVEWLTPKGNGFKFNREDIYSRSDLKKRLTQLEQDKNASNITYDFA